MIADTIYWLTQRRWLLLAAVVGTFLYFLPTPDGLKLDGYHTLIIVLVALMLIVFEPIPLPAVALLIAILQVAFGISTPNEVASSFMSDAVFFIMGSLMLAVAIVQQGLDSRLALGIIRLTGNKTWKLVIGFTAISALLSSFIGEHTVVAMMMPVGLSLLRFTSKDDKKIPGLTSLLLFSIAYGSIVGSVGTPSGGARNVIMLDYWREFDISGITYIKWMQYAYPMLLLEIPLTVFVLWFTFRPEKEILDSAVRRLAVQVANRGKMAGREMLAIAVFGMVFLGWVFLGEKIGLGVVALAGVFLYLTFGLVQWSDLNRNTNWGIILLFGAAISIGLQMKNTGAAEWVASVVMNGLQSMMANVSTLRPVVAVLLTGVLCNIISSSASVAVVGPIALNLGGNSVHIGFATAMSSAFGYFTVVAAPACMIIYSSGLVRSTDFLRAGWKMALVSVAVLILIYNLWWPLLT